MSSALERGGLNRRKGKEFQFHVSGVPGGRLGPLRLRQEGRCVVGCLRRCVLVKKAEVGQQWMERKNGAVENR